MCCSPSGIIPPRIGRFSAVSGWVEGGIGIGGLRSEEEKKEEGETNRDRRRFFRKEGPWKKWVTEREVGDRGKLVGKLRKKFQGNETIGIFIC